MIKSAYCAAGECMACDGTAPGFAEDGPCECDNCNHEGTPRTYGTNRWAHPLPSDAVSVESMKHIQKCEQCRINYASWVPLLDTAQYLEEHPEAQNR